MHPVPATVKFDWFFASRPRRDVPSGIRGRDPFHQRANRNRASWVKGSWKNGFFVPRPNRLHPPTWKNGR